jgi:hypothetical protein
MKCCQVNSEGLAPPVRTQHGNSLFHTKFRISASNSIKSPLEFCFDELSFDLEGTNITKRSNISNKEE